MRTEIEHDHGLEQNQFDFYVFFVTGLREREREKIERMFYLLICDKYLKSNEID